MGLDITCYGNLVRMDAQPENDEDWDQFYDLGGIELLDNEGFPGRALPFSSGCYKGDSLFKFRAGSYSGHNGWRRWLCETFLGLTAADVWQSPDTFKNKPFFELINFSDCEGTIGTDACIKLAKDFQDNEDKALKIDDGKPEHNYGYDDSYKDWMKAFKLAAENNGAVCFH